MIKTITRHGNGHALTLDRALLEQLGLSEGSKVQLTVSGGSLVVTPVEARIDDESFQSAKDKTIARYGRTLERLAKGE